jgi:hypothetical protein
MAISIISKYLEHYSEPIVSWFENTALEQLNRTYQFVLVVPVFAEPLNCLENVLPADLHKTLVIVVVNSALDSDPGAIAQSQAFLKQFNDSYERICLIHLSNENDCLIVDFTSDGNQLPAKQGVGLARKIGGDLALACIQKGIVDCAWIHCTDADAKLPLNYFDADPPSPTVAAAIYPFEHYPLHKNILSYEISLRYYVIQLAKINSPYAFQTIGSLLKINAYHYAMVRGFPKRNAAEDFYMLNKLAKSGQVLRLKKPIIQLASRVSKRVPFGTGAAMLRLEMESAPFELYHPLIFKQLGTWLEVIPVLWRDREQIETQGLSKWWPFGDSILEALSNLKLETVLPSAYRQCQDEDHFLRYLWVWFDAFRTLKFIHILRNRGLAKLPVAEALAESGMLSEMKHQYSTLTLPQLEKINAELTNLEICLPLGVEPTMR